jgi:hypothetical protein
VINTIRHYDIIGVMTGGGPRGRHRGAAGADLQHGVPRQRLGELPRSVSHCS